MCNLLKADYVFTFLPTGFLGWTCLLEEDLVGITGVGKCGILGRVIFLGGFRFEIIQPGCVISVGLQLGFLFLCSTVSQILSVVLSVAMVAPFSGMCLVELALLAVSTSFSTIFSVCMIGSSDT